MYAKEKEMYPNVMDWLEELLAERFKKRKVLVLNTSNRVLSSALAEKSLQHFFPEYLTYEVYADVTGIVYDSESAELVLIECKLDKLNLDDLSQLIGYSKVVQPYSAYIMSPNGIGNTLNLLFNAHKRFDVLGYAPSRFIRIATWDESKRDIDYSTIIPLGSR